MMDKNFERIAIFSARLKEAYKKFDESFARESQAFDMIDKTEGRETPK